MHCALLSCPRIIIFAQPCMLLYPYIFIKIYNDAHHICNIVPYVRYRRQQIERRASKTHKKMHAVGAFMKKGGVLKQIIAKTKASVTKNNTSDDSTTDTDTSSSLLALSSVGEKPSTSSSSSFPPDSMSSVPLALSSSSSFQSHKDEDDSGDSDGENEDEKGAVGDVRHHSDGGAFPGTERGAHRADVKALITGVNAVNISHDADVCVLNTHDGERAMNGDGGLEDIHWSRNPSNRDPLPATVHVPLSSLSIPVAPAPVLRSSADSRGPLESKVRQFQGQQEGGIGQVCTLPDRDRANDVRVVQKEKRWREKPSSEAIKRVEEVMRNQDIEAFVI